MSDLYCYTKKNIFDDWNFFVIHCDCGNKELLTAAEFQDLISKHQDPTVPYIRRKWGTSNLCCIKCLCSVMCKGYRTYVEAETAFNKKNDE